MAHESSVPSEEEEQVWDACRTRSLGEPDDIARCALFLASDDSAWITGIEIVVDGGVESASP